MRLSCLIGLTDDMTWNTVMNYDVLLTDVGNDTLSVAFAVMNSIQQLVPLAVLDVHQAQEWLLHPPILLRRGILGDEARDIQQRYEQLGASVAIIPSQLFFPDNASGISRWCNEWFSEHLLALHERVLPHWAQDNKVEEAYRFNYLPTYGTDVSLRFWRIADTLHATMRRSIGHIGPVPGPPIQDSYWQPTQADWQAVCEAMDTHNFWEADSWSTVPDGYTIVATNHWVMEGFRRPDYKVLVDQTPNEGAAREVGLLFLDLLPDTVTQPVIEH